MKQLKITVKGEPDVAPLVRHFQFADKSEEEIFLSSVLRVKEKLARNLKINVNEALLTYSSFVLSATRDKFTMRRIKQNARRLLSAENVMIGVPETLRILTFELKLSERAAWRTLVLKDPIQVDKNYSCIKTTRKSQIFQRETAR